MSAAERPRIVAFASGKGGSGKSLTAANVGIFLATLGKRVILVDAALGSPTLHLFAGVPRPSRTLSELFRRGGSWLRRGERADPLDLSRRWEFAPLLKAGDAAAEEEVVSLLLVTIGRISMAIRAGEVPELAPPPAEFYAPRPPSAAPPPPVVVNKTPVWIVPAIAALFLVAAAIVALVALR